MQVSKIRDSFYWFLNEFRKVTTKQTFADKNTISTEIIIMETYDKKGQVTPPQSTSSIDKMT